ncbi:hypothetical protein DIPPA_23425 [Diplonema papillatum]|nr:hypothetical protein DIPPA_23425 [Diplonema papillatum]
MELAGRPLVLAAVGVASVVGSAAYITTACSRGGPRKKERRLESQCALAAQRIAERDEQRRQSAAAKTVERKPLRRSNASAAASPSHKDKDRPSGKARRKSDVRSNSSMSRESPVPFDSSYNNATNNTSYNNLTASEASNDEYRFDTSPGAAVPEITFSHMQRAFGFPSESAEKDDQDVSALDFSATQNPRTVKAAFEANMTYHLRRTSDAGADRAGT